MTFPILNDYKTAIRNAKGRLATLKVTPRLDDKGYPVFLAGNFAGVFKVDAPDGKVLAVKCFIRDMPNLEQRHRAVERFITRTKAPYLIDLSFLAKEIYVRSTLAGDGEFPVVVMPWVEGKTLGEVIGKFCDKANSKGFVALTRAWARFCLAFLAQGAAHGDLKHDNILVASDGQFRLIDYDSMYLPELKGLHCPLLGGVNYQHPYRHPHHFNETLDHFSMLVIALSLRALTFDPGLRESYNNGENIILCRDDFLTPERSALLKELKASRDGLTRDWTDAVVKAAASKTVAVPNLKQILAQATRAGIEPEAASRPAGSGMGGSSFSVFGMFSGLRKRP